MSPLIYKTISIYTKIYQLILVFMIFKIIVKPFKYPYFPMISSVLINSYGVCW
nr:MAG TPA: hypothetical protein [Caudoviricetes sp.]